MAVINAIRRINEKQNGNKIKTGENKHLLLVSHFF